MKIEQIVIQNFRSLKSAELDLSSFNIFVGQNNCGKTNMFEAIEWFFNGTGRNQNINDLKFRHNEALEISVSVTFSGATDGASKMKNAANRTKIEKILEGASEVTIVRSSVDGKRKVFVNGEEREPGTGFDKALNDFLPRFEYVHTKQNYDALAKFAKGTPISVMLSDVLAEILKENKQYRDFQEKFSELFGDESSEIALEFEKLGEKVRVNLSKQFPDCSKVKFEVAQPVFDDLLKKFDTTVDDGVETNAAEKGDGMQRALMLAIIQAYADYRREKEESSKSFLFFIDEAELHLHPSAQRKLKDVLLELASLDDQVFINTHSSVLVVDEHPIQSIYKVEKDDGLSDFYKIDEYEKPYVVYELLGGTPGDLLLPRNFLIVEGPSEVNLLTNIIKRFYSDKPKIQIIPADGDIHQGERSINSVSQAFKPLNNEIYKDRVVILLDKPSSKREAAVRDFRNQNKAMNNDGRIIELPVGSLEEHYPDTNGWQKTSEQVKDMTGKKKVKLAKRVSLEITQADFESKMKECFSALGKAWNKSI